MVELMVDGNKWKFYTELLQGLVGLVLFTIYLGMCIRNLARGYLGGAGDGVLTGGDIPLLLLSKIPMLRRFTGGDVKKKQ